MSRSNNWPREYERVTDLKDVDREDMVAFTKAKHQWVRDRCVDNAAIIIIMSTAICINVQSN